MNSKIENELVYVPKRENGLYLFDGLPCPTKKVLEAIGQKGIKHIDKSMKSMLEYRKRMFGDFNKEFYGFSGIQKFLHLPSKRYFILHNHDCATYPQDMSDLVNEELLKEDNFYIIEFYRICDRSKRSIKSLLSGM